jgi:bacterial/archaeal transporter family-2 protein
MKLVWLLVSFAGGAAAAAQPLLTGSLGKSRGLFEGIIVSVTITFATLCSILFVQVTTGRGTGLWMAIPAWAVFVGGLVAAASVIYLIGSGIPAYYYVAGLLGLTILTTTTLATPEIGLGATLAATVGGQMIASLAWDQFGVLGMPVVPISPLRVLGVALLLLGVWLIRPS